MFNPAHQQTFGARGAWSLIFSGRWVRYSSWGSGKYDPRYNLDGKSTPLVLPRAYGLADVRNETYTAEGPIFYWNAYVAVTQMGGRGNFADARLKIDVKHSPDLVTPNWPRCVRTSIVCSPQLLPLELWT